MLFWLENALAYIMTSGEFTISSLLPHHDLFLPGKMLNPLSIMFLMLSSKDFQLTTRQRSSTVIQNKKTRLELSGTLEMIRNTALLKMQFCNLVLIQ